MADNVTLDPGAGGATVGTDEVSLVHYQQVKLVDGTLGSTAAIAGDATNGLDVDVTRPALPSGAATSANQTTLIGHVDGLEGLLTTIDADTSAVAGAVSGTEMQVDVVAALPAGTNNIGDVDIASIAAGDNNIGNVDVVTLPSLPAGTNNIGDVDVLSLPAIPAGNNNIGDVDVASLPALASGTNTIGYVGMAPRSSGGLSIFRTLDADETEEEVSAVACQLYGWFIYNDGAAEVYVKLYNATAANVTVGTTTPVMTIPIPAGAAANVEFTNGIAFGTALCIAATTEVADAGTTAPAANQVIANLFYK